MRDGDQSAAIEAMHCGGWWRVVPRRQHHRTYPPAGGMDGQQQRPGRRSTAAGQAGMKVRGLGYLWLLVPVEDL